MIHCGLWSFILMIVSIWLTAKLAIETKNWYVQNSDAAYISGVSRMYLLYK